MTVEKIAKCHKPGVKDVPPCLQAYSYWMLQVEAYVALQDSRKARQVLQAALRSSPHLKWDEQYRHLKAQVG